MSSNECIITECYIDSSLIEVLLYAGRNHVNHQKGNGTVAKRMKDGFGGSFCIGIIDEDRKELEYLKEFEVQEETVHLKFWKHRKEAHYIIQIRPVIERWILNVCEEAGIALNHEFNLPETLKPLMKISKTRQSKEDIRFINLFKRMLKVKCLPVIMLKNRIEELKKENYNLDINELKNG